MINIRPPLVMAEVGIRRAGGLYPFQKFRDVLLISNKERLRHLVTLFDGKDGFELIVLRNGGCFEEVCDEADAFFGHSLAGNYYNVASYMT